MSNEKERTLEYTKTYTVTIKHYTDGIQHMNRENDGFTPLELIGLCKYISEEIIMQMQEKIKPDIVTREVVVSPSDR
jgi:hypothetical protein